MFRLLCPGFFGLMLFCLGISRSPGRELEPIPPPKPVLNQDDVPPLSFRGRVTVVTGESITIKPEGDIKITESRYLGDGRWEVLSVYRQDNTKPPRTFVFDDGLLFLNGTLPAGGRAKHIAISNPSQQHKISDVRPGDHVQIRCNRVQGVDCCRELHIVRRYGGRVPPAIGDDKLPKDLQHLRIDTLSNAEQAREEKALRILSRLARCIRP